MILSASEDAMLVKTKSYLSFFDQFPIGQPSEKFKGVIKIAPRCAFRLHKSRVYEFDGFDLFIGHHDGLYHMPSNPSYRIWPDDNLII